MQTFENAVGHVVELKICTNMLAATMALQLVVQVYTSSKISLVSSTDTTQHGHLKHLRKYLPIGICAFETKLCLLTLTRSTLQVTQ